MTEEYIIHSYPFVLFSRLVPFSLSFQNPPKLPTSREPIVNVEARQTSCNTDCRTPEIGQ